MLQSEFENLTGYCPTCEEYAVIEKNYSAFPGGKHEFCRLWAKVHCDEIAHQQRLFEVASKIGAVQTQIETEIWRLERRIEQLKHYDKQLENKIDNLK